MLHHLDPECTDADGIVIVTVTVAADRSPSAEVYVRMVLLRVGLTDAVEFVGTEPEA